MMAITTSSSTNVNPRERPRGGRTTSACITVPPTELNEKSAAKAARERRGDILAYFSQLQSSSQSFFLNRGTRGNELVQQRSVSGGKCQTLKRRRAGPLKGLTRL